MTNLTVIYRTSTMSDCTWGGGQLHSSECHPKTWVYGNLWLSAGQGVGGKAPTIIFGFTVYGISRIQTLKTSCARGPSDVVQMNWFELIQVSIMNTGFEVVEVDFETAKKLVVVYVMNLIVGVHLRQRRTTQDCEIVRKFFKRYRFINGKGQPS